MFDEGRIRENWEALNSHVRKLTDRPVKIIAVTKTHPEEIYDLCVKIGIEEIGENRIQELLAKNEAKPEARKKLKVHLIGPLQTNKVKFLAGNVDSFDTLSSAETIDKINSRWTSDSGKSLEQTLAQIPGQQTGQPGRLPVLLQINSTDETGKAGLHYEDRPAIIALARQCIDSPNLHLEGLMTMGPTPEGAYDVPDPKYVEDTRKAFKRTRDLIGILENELSLALPRLSMGMTHDYDIAIDCGATEIRVGSLIFGEREYFMRQKP